MSKWLMKQQMREEETISPEAIAELDAKDLALAQPVVPESLFTCDGTKTVWELINGELSNLGFSAQDLIDHNEIPHPNEPLPDGYTLHLPYPKKSPVEERSIRYELFPGPRPMHVNLKGGTKKQSFGNAKQWSDIKPTGPGYKQDANIDALAVAYVPIGDDMAAYYLDASEPWQLPQHRPCILYHRL
jgi:hypothetical protein